MAERKRFQIRAVAKSRNQERKEQTRTIMLSECAYKFEVQNFEEYYFSVTLIIPNVTVSIAETGKES